MSHLIKSTFVLEMVIALIRRLDFGKLKGMLRESQMLLTASRCSSLNLSNGKTC